ncbi:hypothetical protein ACIBH1_34570 [Nonomuraea sp. NPDC050663]|uniref:hypothetical protein n=1 Tax=Nonomuraea sp. NPDC050663 TaxID=3364370 RepID=UPI00379E90D7
MSLFGCIPATATAEGLVGAMLRSGGFLKEMTGREIVRVMAAPYPAEAARIADERGWL